MDTFNMQQWAPYPWALAIATEAHDGQTRLDSSTAYITHPVAVAARVEATLVSRLNPGMFHVDLHWLSTVAKVAAVLHDVLEDNPTFPLAERLRVLLPDTLVDPVLTLVGVLSKMPGKDQDYLDYLLDLRFNRAGLPSHLHFVARGHEC